MPDTPIAQAPLRLNGEARAWTPGLTLATLIERHGLAPQTVATAVNGHFVPCEQRGTTVLRPGDDVLTFQPIVGG